MVTNQSEICQVFLALNESTDKDNLAQLQIFICKSNKKKIYCNGRIILDHVFIKYLSIVRECCAISAVAKKNCYITNKRDQHVFIVKSVAMIEFLKNKYKQKLKTEMSRRFVASSITKSLICIQPVNQNA